MTEKTYDTFIARIPVESQSDEFDCYAYETIDHEYCLAYHDKTEDEAYLIEQSVPYDQLKIIGEKQVFVQPFHLSTISEILQ